MENKIERLILQYMKELVDIDFELKTLDLEYKSKRSTRTRDKILMLNSKKLTLSEVINNLAEIKVQS